MDALRNWFWDQDWDRHAEKNTTKKANKIDKVVYESICKYLSQAWSWN